MFAADITLIQRIVKGAAVTPVLAAPGGVAGIIAVKAKVATVLKIPGAHTESGRYVVVFKPINAAGDLFGVIVDKPGDINEAVELPKECEIIDVKKITGSIFKGENT